MTWVRQTQTVAGFEAQQDRFRLFVVTLVVFLSALPIVFWSLDEFSWRRYFVLGFVWFLITSEVFAPAEPEAVWWRRLRWVKAAGWLVLAYIVSERVAAVV
ncbi:hypothetical protein GRX03_15365 [Halovenus sp. WSH3]|uniref:Uncharacterized protein n=1 Tax=Halovenus carboxidivorans TaxID=2692199 RepID=A0A6B0T7Q9_9EURY|nr:hypothetical protein [Halovenus carboxidivorans]MXR52977.1 hypothetical protein [Halovenus carboxidivorans]